MKIRQSIIITLVMFVVILSIWCLLQLRSFLVSPLLIQKEIVFTLPKGTSFYSLEKMLHKQHLIQNNHWWLYWLIKLKPKLSKIKAGTYLLKPGMTVNDLLFLLVSGKEAQFAICFTEGLTLKEWLNILAQASYLKQDLQNITPQTLAIKWGEPVNNILEGQFYPDTYLYVANTAASIILKRAHHRMQVKLDEIWQKRDKGLPYDSPQTLLIVASIIEKETQMSKEKPQIASVLLNRLRKGMKLQIDPTVIYGMGENYKGKITRQDLIKPTPYNTYVITGLPPTPIAMPGYDSLKAAAHPEKSIYLYFVSDGHGKHIFSTNLTSHNLAVQKYRHRKINNE